MQHYGALELPKRRAAPVPVNVSIDGEETLLMPPAPFDYFNTWWYDYFHGWSWWQSIPIVVEMSIAGDDL